MGRGSLFEKNTRLRERPNLWLMVFRFPPPYNENTVDIFIPQYAEKGGRTLEPYIPVSR